LTFTTTRSACREQPRAVGYVMDRSMRIRIDDFLARTPLVIT
jgi:hypothetical protein